MPAIMGMRTCSMLLMKSRSWSVSNTGWVMAYCAPASTLYSNRRNSSSGLIAPTVMQHGLNSNLLLHQHGGSHCAHSRLRARTVRNVHAIDACNLQQTDRFQGLVRVDAFRWQHLDRGDEFTVGYLARPMRAFSWRNNFDVSRGDFMNLSCRASVHNHTLRPWRSRAHGIRDQLDMRGSGTTATADEPCSRLNEAFCELRHVFRRAHVKLSSLHVARQAGVRLR